MKKTLFFLLAVCTFAFRADAADKLRAIYNGETLDIVRSKMVDGVRYAALKDMAKVCSAGLSWFRVSGKSVMTLNNSRVGFFYGTKKITVDSKKHVLEHPIILSGGKGYVSMDFITGELFRKVSGLEVKYSDATGIITLESKPNVGHPRIYSEDGVTKVVFELAEPLKYSLDMESSRMYSLSFYRGRMDKGSIDFNDENIRGIELRNRRRTAVSRIRLQEKGLMVRADPGDDRLTVTVSVSKKAVEPEDNTAAIIPPGVSTCPAAAAATGQVLVYESREDSREQVMPACTGIKRVVIDPGHGGEDPGAVGINGTKEKDINLRIAGELSRLLRKAGYEVLLTREEDVFIPLYDRTKFANDNNADIFVSLHCNASPREKSQGYEIYFLSENASDADAEATAAFENAVIRMEKKKLSKKRRKLQELLWSMVVNEFINESSELCSFITEEMTRRVKIKNRGIKQAGFYVLRGAQMPSVLVEFAFLSNMREEARLNSRKFQKQVSDAVYEGIRKYDSRKSMLAKRKTE